jgi:hypothetical protein
MTDQVSPEGVATPSTGAPVPQATPAQDTAGTPTETRAESPPAVETKAEPKGVAKRIDELTRLRRDAERDRDYWREFAMRTPQQAPQQQPAQQPAQPKSLKDFNYDEKQYTDHLYEQARKVAEQSAREAGAKFRAEQEAITRRAKFDERVTQFKATVEDYDDVVHDGTPVSEHMADALLDSEEAGPVMYYLGQNPDVATKLYHMSAAKAGREIQKIEDRLVSERKKAAEKPVSQAPPPAPVIEATAPGHKVKSTDPEALSMSGDEWRRLREKELAARKRKA